jgi:raffinose/stachyose/melibiose transport system permease protein
VRTDATQAATQVARQAPRQSIRRPSRAWQPYVKSLVMGLVLLVFIMPIILVVLGSFKTTPQLIGDPLGIPSAPTLDSYADAFKRMDYLNSLWNTAWITSCSVMAICFFGSMAAYFIARVAWRPNKIIFYLLVVSMIVPFQVLMIPMIKILGTLGLLKSSWILVYVYLAGGVPLAVIMYSAYIRSIPVELDEAAMLDGADRRQTFFRVILPLLRPMTLTLVLLNTLFIWNDFLLPFLVLRRQDQRTLTLTTLAFFQNHTTDYASMMAALILTMAPVFVLYVFFQRHIIAGLVRGAIK